MALNNLCFKIKQPAEFYELPLVITIEEYLVEAGEAEHVLIAVHLHQDRNDTATRGRNFHVLNHRAGGDQEL